MWHHNFKSCGWLSIYAPAEGRRMETQVEPFICPFCYTTPSLPPFSSVSAPNFTWCPLISVGLLFANRSIEPMSALGWRRLCTSFRTTSSDLSLWPWLLDASPHHLLIQMLCSRSRLQCSEKKIIKLMHGTRGMYVISFSCVISVIYMLINAHQLFWSRKC